MNTLIRFVFLSLIVTFACPLYAQTLTLYTEEFPPYNFTQEGQITGVSTEVVKQVLVRAGFKINITSLPWDRAYHLAQKKDNALIYSISRRQNRENLFKWIGVLTPTTYSVFGLNGRSDVKVKTLRDLKRYKIGTSIDDARESYLLEKGFELSDFNRVGGDHTHLRNLKKLIDRRIDVWPMPDAVAYFTAKQEGHDNPAKVLKKLLSLDELSGGYYLAASLKTSDRVVSRIAKALEDFVQTGAYKKTLNDWGLNASGLIEFAHVEKLIYAIKYFTRIDSVGFLAGDTPSSHKDAEWFRRGVREDVIERYARTFDEWQDSFTQMQSQVDVLVLGNNSGIKDWNSRSAKEITMAQSRVPTGCVMDWMADYVFIGYAKGNLILNKTIAEKLQIEFPDSFVKKAARIIE
jgi:polar amino acid transport system substrate-binding protein